MTSKMAPIKNGVCRRFLSAMTGGLFVELLTIVLLKRFGSQVFLYLAIKR
jgi:hypothetical protein